MSFQSYNDNLWKEGSFVTAKVNPLLKLQISKYNHRIYYCFPVDNPSLKALAYFERALIAVDDH